MASVSFETSQTGLITNFFVILSGFNSGLFSLNPFLYSLVSRLVNKYKNSKTTKGPKDRLFQDLTKRFVPDTLVKLTEYNIPYTQSSLKRSKGEIFAFLPCYLTINFY